MFLFEIANFIFLIIYLIMDDFTFAQPYDMSEYWNQFDDQSRWKGFSTVEEKTESIVSEDDEIIEAIQYIDEQCNKKVESPAAEQRNPLIQNHLGDQNIESISKLNKSVESRLQEVFDRMKETVK